MQSGAGAFGLPADMDPSRADDLAALAEEDDLAAPAAPDGADDREESRSTALQDSDLDELPFPLLAVTSAARTFQLDFKAQGLPNGLDADIASRLAKFIKLQHLSLEGCGLAGIDGFPHLPALETLELSNNPELCQLSPLREAPLPRLRSLALANTGVAEFAHLEALADLPALVHLQLQGSQLWLDLDLRDDNNDDDDFSEDDHAVQDRRVRAGLDWRGLYDYRVSNPPARTRDYISSVFSVLPRLQALDQFEPNEIHSDVLCLELRSNYHASSGRAAGLALAMALHPRLGADSVAARLDADLMRRIMRFRRLSHSRRLIGVHLRTGLYVDRIELRYSDGFQHQRGGNGGEWRSPFLLEPGEGIVRVECRYGDALDSIRFVTSRGRESPRYGGKGGSATRWIEAPPGSEILCFEMMAVWSGWLSGAPYVREIRADLAPRPTAEEVEDLRTLYGGYAKLHAEPSRPCMSHGERDWRDQYWDEVANGSPSSGSSDDSDYGQYMMYGGPMYDEGDYDEPEPEDYFSHSGEDYGPHSDDESDDDDGISDEMD